MAEHGVTSYTSDITNPSSTFELIYYVKYPYDAYRLEHSAKRISVT